ncbi:hypothetical protein Tco_0873091 [Tanacetum coccineum]
MNKVINEDNVEIESVVNEEVEIREEHVINQTMENENKANEEIDDSVNKESMNVVMDKCGGSNGVTDGNMNGSKMDNANEGNGIGRMSDENVELDERSPCWNDCSHEQTSTVNQSGNVKSGDVKKTASYVSMAKNYQNMVNNKLSHILTKLREDGTEVVIFDEEIMDEGRKK